MFFSLSACPLWVYRNAVYLCMFIFYPCWTHWLFLGVFGRFEIFYVNHHIIFKWEVQSFHRDGGRKCIFLKKNTIHWVRNCINTQLDKIAEMDGKICQYFGVGAIHLKIIWQYLWNNFLPFMFIIRMWHYHGLVQGFPIY